MRNSFYGTLCRLPETAPVFPAVSGRRRLARFKQLYFQLFNAPGQVYWATPLTAPYDLPKNLSAVSQAVLAAIIQFRSEVVVASDDPLIQDLDFH